MNKNEQKKDSQIQQKYLKVDSNSWLSASFESRVDFFMTSTIKIKKR